MKYESIRNAGSRTR